MSDEFEINGKTYQIQSPYGQSSYRTLLKHHRGAFGIKPRMIYLWDCALEPGGNLFPPTHHAVECDLVFLRLTNTGRPPYHKIDVPASTEQARALVRGTNSSVSEIQSILNRKIRPSIFEVPLKSLTVRMPKNAKYVIVAWTVPGVLWLQRTETPKDEGFYLVFPSSVWFRAIQYGWCGEVEPGRPLKVEEIALSVIGNEDPIIRKQLRQQTRVALRKLKWTGMQKEREAEKRFKDHEALRNQDTMALGRRFAKALGGL